MDKKAYQWWSLPVPFNKPECAQSETETRPSKNALDSKTRLRPSKNGLEADLERYITSSKSEQEFIRNHQSLQQEEDDMCTHTHTHTHTERI